MSALSLSLVVNALLAALLVVTLSSSSSLSSGLARSRISSRSSLSSFRSPLSLQNRVCHQASGTMARRGVSVNGQTYKVTLKTPGGDHEIECPDDMYILDKAEMDGIALPYSCRAGFCISCAGIMEDGTVDQSDQTFLNEDQVKQGIVLTCFARPTSDMTVRTHVENELSL